MATMRTFVHPSNGHVYQYHIRTNQVIIVPPEGEPEIEEVTPAIEESLKAQGVPSVLTRGGACEACKA